MTFVALLGLLVLSGIISGSETAAFSLRPGQRRKVAPPGSVAGAVLARPGALLVTLLLANLFTNVAYFSLSASMSLAYADAGQGVRAAAVSVGSLVAIILLGEIVPKTVALSRADWIIDKVAPGLYALRLALTPLVALAQLVTRLLEALVTRGRLPPAEFGTEEFKTVVAAGAAAGTYRRVELDLLHDVIDFGLRRAKSLMVPRVDVVFLDVRASRESWLATMAAHPHADYPACDGSPDRILGMVNAARLVRSPEADLRALEPALYLPLTLRSERLVEALRESDARVAVLLDEFGGVAGVVALSDVARVVLGEIGGEGASPESTPVLPRPAGSFLVAGTCPLQTLRDEAGLAIETRRAETVGGAVAERLGSVPRRGDEVVIDGWRLRVVAVEGRRVDRVLARPVAEDDA